MNNEVTTDIYISNRRYILNSRLSGLGFNFIILILLSLAITNTALAGFAFGYVYSREMVTNEAGNRFWAEYRSDTGAFVDQIGEATGALDPALVGRLMRGPVLL